MKIKQLKANIIFKLTPLILKLSDKILKYKNWRKARHNRKLDNMKPDVAQLQQVLNHLSNENILIMENQSKIMTELKNINIANS